MPTIYIYLGFVFKFYSDEHEPIHVHAIAHGCETAFEVLLENGVVSEIRTRTISGKRPLSSQDEKKAREFVEAYAGNIVEKWVNFFIKKKNIRITKITKKI
jgi:hypothetical protein